jgi:hypothetical protein
MRCSQAVEQQVGIAFDGEHGMMNECQKLFVAQMGEKLKEEVGEAADIERPDWLEVDAKRKPGEYLDDFLKSAKTSGKCCKAGHEVFAFMHRFNGDKLRES